ncbi:MAG: RHS repeat-associated core domain-containing protein [Polyangiaceae bacterium]|nr:RHS repeat-associated core domain-containing protein [Polyangiaceae bacterium]
MELRAGRPRPHRREDRDDARRHPSACLRIRPRGSPVRGLRGRPPRRGYSFDDNGNRLSSLNADGVFDATFDDQDRILEYGDEVFTWTDNGELYASTDTATGDTTTYAYDALGNLRGVALPNGDLIEYLVDGRGRRVGKKLNGVLERGWLWRGQLQPVAELDGAGNVVARFVYAGGVNVPALMVTPTATYRLVTDHLGSVRRVVDVATGAVAQELDYDAWGRVLLDTNPGLQPFGFAGGLYDPDTGLVRFGARDYDAETGRWTSKDPIRFGGGVNLYAYAGSDPINTRDAEGLYAQSAELGSLEAEPQDGGSGGSPFFEDEPTECAEKKKRNERLELCLDVKTAPTDVREEFCKTVIARAFRGKNVKEACLRNLYESANKWAGFCNEYFGENDP